MSAKLFYKKLLLILPLCLLPGWAFALVYENGVISGVEPNTVVELVLPSGETSSATANEEGEVQVTREENDDPAGLYIPPGTSGPGELKNKASGATIGNLNISDYSITVYSVADSVSAFTGSENDLRLTLGIGASNLGLDTTANNTANGRMDAENQGFSTIGSADNDVAGTNFTIGLAAGDGNPWTSKGSSQWKLSMGYNRWRDLDGQFRASQSGVTLVSSGQAEVESLQLTATYEYFLADGFGLSASLGWERYESEDSGNIVRVEDGMELSSFSESNEDTIGTLGIGLSYWPTDCIGLQASYRYGFSNVGGGDSDNPSVFGLDVIFAF